MEQFRNAIKKTIGDDVDEEDLNMIFMKVKSVLCLASYTVVHDKSSSKRNIQRTESPLTAI